VTADVLIAGLSGGANIALLAVAFYLTYLLARTFHIALAGVYALVPFVAWELVQRGLSLLVAACIATAIGGLVSVLCEFANHGPLRRRHATAEAHLLSSLGIYIAISQVLLLVWGPEARVLRVGLEPTYAMAGLVLRRTEILTIATAGLSIIVLWGFFRATRLGVVTQALQDNPEELELLGFNTSAVRLLLFAIGGIYGALAALLASLEGGFEAHYGFPSFLLAVVATLSVRGGGILGTALAGIALGGLRALCSWTLGARWQDTLSYGLFAVALLLQNRPFNRTTGRSGLRP